jgi:Xaa-Pro aminopeptidase
MTTHSALNKIRTALHESDAVAYVATTPSNIRYVTGFGRYFVSEWWRMHGRSAATRRRLPAAASADRVTAGRRGPSR